MPLGVIESFYYGLTILGLAVLVYWEYKRSKRLPRLRLSPGSNGMR